MEEINIEKLEDLIQKSTEIGGENGVVEIKISELKTLVERAVTERERIEQAARFEIERLAALFESKGTFVGEIVGEDVAEEIRSLQPIHYSHDIADRFLKLLLWCRPRLGKDQYRDQLDQYLSADVADPE